MNFLQYLCLIITSSFTIANGARILAIHTSASRSHYIFAEVLLKELAKRGHNVNIAATLKLFKLQFYINF